MSVYDFYVSVCFLGICMIFVSRHGLRVYVWSKFLLMASIKELE